MIEAVFFDIDDTLYDRSTPFRRACEEFFPIPPEDPYAAYLCVKARGDEVFLPSQRGEITMEEMVIFRVCRGFADVGIDLTPEEALSFNACYRSKQGEISLSDTMRGILSFCRTSVPKLGLITNGTSEKQRRKIASLALSEFVLPELILVSGEVKLDKPDLRLYELAQSRCGCPAEKILYIGDSIEHDIAPASLLGWKTVLLDRNREHKEKTLPSGCTLAQTEEELARVIHHFDF